MKKNKGFLLFKNAFKQVLRNKIQLIGLAVLTLLSSTIFSLMQTSVARVTNEYNLLISEQQSNIHDFVLDPYNTVKKTNAPSAPEPPKTPEPGATLEEQQLYLNQIANQGTNKFIWDRIETRTFQINNNDDPKILKLIAYNQYARINRLVISHGHNIGENPNIKTPVAKQTVINKEFAEKNHLKIGDVIRVQEDRLGSSLKVNQDLDINDPELSSFNWFEIVGYGVSADFITPIIDETTPLPNKTKEGILYINPVQFGLTPLTDIDNNTLWYYNKSKEILTIASNKDSEIYYVGKWTSNEKNLKVISDFFKERYTNISNFSAALIYGLGDSNYRFNSRTSTLPSTITAFITLLICLLTIVLLITGITIILITYKNIDNSKPQIGILKSLGYSNWKILITSLAYPMLAAFLGTILVFFPASGLQVLVVNTFANYFNLNFGRFVIDGLGYLYCFLLTFGFLSLIAWVISALTVIKKPIDLINNISTTRDSKFTKFIKKSSTNRSFLTRFRLALFTSSIGKMAAAALTMFLGTVLMSTAIIGPKIMSDNQRVTYTGMNYKSLTEYVIPTYNSPFSFYKTYNPNNKPWEYKTTSYDEDNKNYYTHPERSNEKYAQELLANSINSEAYAPIAADPADPSSIFGLSLSGLTYLYGKMMTKSFLDGLENSNLDFEILIPMIVQLAWPEALPVYNIINKTDTIENLYTLENYQALRTFYINYRSTIAMSLNPQVTSSDKPKEINKEKFINFASAKSKSAWKADEANFKATLDEFITEGFDNQDKKYPWHIKNEREFISTIKPKDDIFRDKWIRKSSIWFYAIFYNRIGQAIAQGTYTKSPYFIKQNIAKAFEDPEKQFNISFNVLPFDKTTDELGTYFVGTPDKKFGNKQYPIKVYGLQNETQLGRPSFMQLYDVNGNSLNHTLERNNESNSINIVINQTVAKQLDLKTNQTFLMATNGSIMKTKANDSSDYQEIELEKINFNKITNNYDGNENKENNATLLNQNVSYDQITKTKNGAYANGGNNATPMLKEVSQGNVVIDYDNKPWHKFRVAGIYNGYGDPTAYISKTHADQLLHFTDYQDENGVPKPGAIKALYEMYKREWQEKGIVKLENKNIDFSELKNLSYEDFSKRDENDTLRVIFKNEFPIFNFKLSNSSNLPDMTQTFSISQNYGDFSALGMNGGLDIVDNVSYQGHGQGTIANLLPLYVHKQLLNQITQLVNTVLLFFIIFSLTISFFIILLTSNLVIYENKKIIVTMKTLGYSDAKITNIVIGMYLPVIAAMFLIGFPVGLVIVQYIINLLAYNTTWVLPFLFAWWIPVVVGLIVLGIYAVTFIIEWYALKRIKILQVMNETN